ncbi:MAG: divalent metal cation transporter [Micavibrio aeruginosavorus]|uniref:Divalent metal cation transporter MntH n=1 Tax=Micavibrio aeruginosavorus TaxID=349221 RepID=A0A2W5N2N5_9BACT|nr:MAG: divalent metal cation transporter [Micavibrio aeruginosavorus]
MSPDALKLYMSQGWRSRQGDASLSDVHASIPVKKGWGIFRKFMAFFGPGYLVAVGYMDPGNWATSLAGGSQFGYTLLAVALISNLMAILLQSLCARLGIGSGRDLAQACRDSSSKPVSFVLWILAELAICATDLAEVIGTAIGLYLLFNIPMEIGVIITALDVFLVLAFQRLGFRWVEAFVITLLIVIFACFGVQVFLADPDLGAIAAGFIPSPQIVANPAMLYIALGIIGATVMPHNLYLHSAVVQTRAVGTNAEDKREAIKFATIDSTIALMLALFINASILILAAAAFHAHGNTEVFELEHAHTLLAPALGTAIAAPLFAIALLCCGLNSTVTATLAGQVVMEGFINIRLKPWVRRLITRAIAIVPAIIVTMIYGGEGTAKLLIASQVVLSLQLPFAVVPLVLYTANKKKMGNLVAPKWVSILAALIAVILICLNVKMLWDLASSAL